jgi:hypothetical protein
LGKYSPESIASLCVAFFLNDFMRTFHIFDFKSVSDSFPFRVSANLFAGLFADDAGVPTDCETLSRATKGGGAIRTEEKDTERDRERRIR